MRARTHPLALAAAALALAVAAPASAPAATKRCAHADRRPTAATLKRARVATLCLVNRERTRRGLRALRANDKLRGAAEGHSGDMAGNGYFAHDTPGGQTVVDRVRATGYLRRTHAWAVGENIAWAGGRLATPRQIVRMWMQSPGHRANILSADYREIGIGIAPGIPLAGHSASKGATYTTDFGARS